VLQDGQLCCSYGNECAGAAAVVDGVEQRRPQPPPPHVPTGAAAPQALAGAGGLRPRPGTPPPPQAHGGR